MKEKLKKYAHYILILTLALTSLAFYHQTTLRVNGNGSSAFIYVGVMSGIPATCNVAEIAYITDQPQGENIQICYNANNWTTAGVPSGAIVLSQAACASGWTEVSMSGKYPLLTVSANGDVGTTGGSLNLTGTAATFTTVASVSLLGAGTALNGPTSYTPAGTIQPTFYKLIPCKKN